MTRATALLAGVLAACAVLVFSSAGPAAALAPSAVGWWWEAEQGAAAVPPPPTVPTGGFMVGADPTGPNAVAAMHFTLADDDTAPMLTLQVADNGNVNGASNDVVACPSASPWKPASPGNWAEKPAARCDTYAKGTLSADGKSVTFALAPVVSADGSTIDIVLTPASGANFELSFNAPSATSLATTKVALASTSDGASASDSSSAAGISTADAPLGDLSSAGPTPLLTAPFGATAPPPADNPVVTLTTPHRTTPAAAVGALGVSTRRTPAVAVLLLLMVGAAGWALGRVPVPGLRRLGALGTSATPPAGTPRQESASAGVGGLGRFARTRHGAPPKL
jgi:hypothetical protein